MLTSQPSVVNRSTSLYIKNIKIKNMQYAPIKEQTVVIPVDNSIQFVVLALLALMGEQARRERQINNTQREELPVIVF